MDKEIEVVTGDGSELEISAVKEHLTSITPKAKEEKPKNIVIPTDIKVSVEEDSNSDDNYEENVIEDYEEDVTEDLVESPEETSNIDYQFSDLMGDDESEDI